MNVYLEAFLPLFVAMNLPGVLPLFIGLTQDLDERARRRLTIQAVTAAGVLAVLILFAGQLIFRVLGITVNDLRVGGGLILLVLSITDLIFGDYRRRSPNGEAGSEITLGVVPIGIPLVIGPAAITTILVAQQSFGYLPTFVSLAVNLALVLTGFFYAPALMRLVGTGTTKAVAKVASLFLAAISVAMIRVGIIGMIAAA